MELFLKRCQVRWCVFCLCFQSNLSACHAPHRVSRCVVVPGRNTPAPSVQFEFWQFVGVTCARHDRCALAIKLRQTSAHTHVATKFAVGSGTSDVRIARHWTTVWPFQVMVGARVVGMFFSSGSGRSVSFGLFEPATSVDLRAC